jgi:hypothetical protein
MQQDALQTITRSTWLDETPMTKAPMIITRSLTKIFKNYLNPFKPYESTIVLTQH